MVRIDSTKPSKAGEVAQRIGLMRGPNADPDAPIAVIPPLVLPAKLWRIGTINYLPDGDGVGRRYYLRHRIGGWDLPSLPARVAMDLGYPVPDADDMVLAWRGAGRVVPARLVQRPVRGLRALEAAAAGRRVPRQDRGDRRRRRRPRRPARHAALAHPARRRDPRHGDREPEERPPHALCAGLVAGGNRPGAADRAVPRVPARRRRQGHRRGAGRGEHRAARGELDARRAAGAAAAAHAARRGVDVLRRGGAVGVPARAPPAPGGGGDVLALRQPARGHAAARAGRHQDRSGAT